MIAVAWGYPALTAMPQSSHSLARSPLSMLVRVGSNGEARQRDHLLTARVCFELVRTQINYPKSISPG